jgi:hypothetical protein
MSTANDPTNPQDKASEPTDPAGTPDASNATGTAQDAQPKTQAQPDTAAAVPSKTPEIDEALHDAFMLGWSIVELRSRVQIASDKSADPDNQPNNPNNNPNDSSLRLVSVWRAIFFRIGGLQSKVFPECTVAKTLYEPPSKDGLPYLYPPEPDYADVGISARDKEGRIILEKFQLFEITRRAINCLTLLYVDKEDSLIPDLIAANQRHLVEAILKAAQNPGAGGGEVPPPDSTELSPTRLKEAQQTLTGLIVRFLNAWDGYLRESYFMGGTIPNDDLELVAYEAGRTMSSLSWNVSIGTARVKKRANDKLSQPPESGDAQSPDTPQDMGQVWKEVFGEKVVIGLQHQISVLSSALDNAYYSKHPELKQPDGEQESDDNTVLIKPNPDLPGQAIHAVKQGLDYWQRAVQWIPNNLDKRRPSAGTEADSKTTPDDDSWSDEMRLALIEQTNIWQTLITGQQSLRAYNLETATFQIMEDFTQDIQKSMRTDFGAGLQQAEIAMKQVADEAKGAIAAVGKTATDGLEALFRSFVPYLWWIVGAIAVVFILLFVVTFLGKETINAQAAGASEGVGITGIISAILGYLGLRNTRAKKDEQQKAISDKKEDVNQKVENRTADAAGIVTANAGNDSLLSRIEGAAQGTGAVILKALERGYEQIRIELDGLNRSVAVAYPLVEFFLRTFELKSDAEFLTGVIWDKPERTEELKRVMRAAFGPLAVFITPTAADTKADGDKPLTQATEPARLTPGSGIIPAASR